MWHSYVITRIFLAEFIDIFFQAYERLFGECAKKKEQKFITIAIEIFRNKKTCHIWSHSETTATNEK